jgi:lipoprotein-releasing system permease protein
MKNSFEWFVSVRYLIGVVGREEGRGFLRFITLVAIGGVAVGVASLLLALSIVAGFSNEIESKIVGWGAHVQVFSMRDEPIQAADTLAQALERLGAVVDVSPVVKEFILLRRSANEIDGVSIWGAERPPAFIENHIIEGSSSFQDSARTPGGGTLGGMLIGRQLARTLGLSVGEVVTAFSMRTPAGDEMDVSLLSRPRVKQFRVTGVYETSLANFDELFVFTDIEEARGLLDYAPDEVTRIDLTLKRVSDADSTSAYINQTWGFPIEAYTIYEVYRNLFAWVDLQEQIIPLVIAVIILVAAFNIIGALLMIILEKTREVGLLRSLGVTAHTLRRLFILLGLLIGCCGTLIGELLALVLGLLQLRYEIIPLPAEAYYISTAPIELNALHFVLVGVVALVLCVAAAYIPARFAARIEPIRAIRFR